MECSFQDQRKSGKGMREALAMANQAFLMELNVSFNNLEGLESFGNC